MSVWKQGPRALLPSVSPPSSCRHPRKERVGWLWGGAQLELHFALVPVAVPIQEGPPRSGGGACQLWLEVRKAGPL